MKTKTIPDEGLYEMALEGESYTINVLDTMSGQWPCKTTSRMAYFLDGPPRFPIEVATLLRWGYRFNGPKTQS